MLFTKVRYLVRSMTRKKNLFLISVSVAAVLCTIAVTIVIQNHTSFFYRKVPARVSCNLDERLRAIFRDDTKGLTEKYDFLFLYFVTGYLRYRLPVFSLADYPGAGSSHGLRLDQMEGFTRMLPLICSWLSSGRERLLRTFDGQMVDLEEIVRLGLINGTDPAAPGFWGYIGDHDQRMVEAADVALSIWLIRDGLWRKLSSKQKRQIVAWLSSAKDKRVRDNNWHLFPVVIGKVIKALGYEYNLDEVKVHYLRMKSFYKGDGWFSDGPDGKFDYYNAWCIHYLFFWLDQIDPDFDRKFIRKVMGDFVRNYVYFFSPKGFPIMGRSLCYRMAASAPLIAIHLQDDRVISAGIAQKSFDSLWRYFIFNKGLISGNITQGYCGKDLRMLDGYSGAGSCLWGLRSLVLAVQLPEKSFFWAGPPGKLPVEINNYRFSIPAIGWTVSGVKETGEVFIKTGKHADNGIAIKNYGIIYRMIELLTGRPHRPNNYKVKYDLPLYSSKEPFCGCPSD